MTLLEELVKLSSSCHVSVNTTDGRMRIDYTYAGGRTFTVEEVFLEDAAKKLLYMLTDWVGRKITSLERDKALLEKLNNEL